MSNQEPRHVDCPACDGAGCAHCDDTGTVTAEHAEDIIDAMIWASFNG